MTLGMLRRIPKSDVREVEAALIRFLVQHVALGHGCMNVQGRPTDKHVNKKRKLGETFAAQLGIETYQGESDNDHGETDSDDDCGETYIHGLLGFVPSS